jgi:hypothetical protein
MIPAFIANHAGANGVTTTFTATLPTGTQIGDLLYTAIAYRNNVTWSTNNNLGAWVQVHSSATGNSNTAPANGRASLSSFYHIYNGISPNLTFTATANANVWRQTTLAIRGINPTGGTNTLGNTSILSQTVATATPNTTAITIGPNAFCVIVVAGGCDDTCSAYTTGGTNPATWTERHDALSTSGGDTMLAVATATGNTLGGATGTVQATCTNVSFHCIGIAEFKPYLRSRQRYTVR